MKAQHTYEDQASYVKTNVRWLLRLNDQEVQIFCNGLCRIYDIPEPVTDFKVEDNYVYIYVEGGNYYQFKFEIDMFVVGDIFNANDEHVTEFACYNFNDDEV